VVLLLLCLEDVVEDANLGLDVKFVGTQITECFFRITGCR
jgi:hypothetical protein